MEVKIEKDEQGYITALNGVKIKGYYSHYLNYIDEHSIMSVHSNLIYDFEKPNIQDMLEVVTYFEHGKLFYNKNTKELVSFDEPQDIVNSFAFVDNRYWNYNIPKCWLDDTYVLDATSSNYSSRYISRESAYELAPNVFILYKDRNNYVICDCCGGVTMTSYSTRDNSTNKIYCNTCWRDKNGEICSYHSHHSNGIKRMFDVNNIIKDESQFKGFGIELETELKSENRNENREEIKKLKSILGDHIYYERDGSLSYGFEHITQPHTYDAMLALNWKDYLAKLISMGYRSHMGGHCGYHIHASRTLFGNTKDEQENNIAKIMCFYALFTQDLIKFSRRNGFGYCEINGVYSKDKNDCVYKTKSCSYRYEAINLNNKNTVEFRIARGTLKYETFIATFKFTAHIIKRATELDWDAISDYHNWLEGLDEDTLAYLKKRHCFNLSTSTTNPRAIGEV